MRANEGCAERVGVTRMAVFARISFLAAGTIAVKAPIAAARNFSRQRLAASGIVIATTVVSLA